MLVVTSMLALAVASATFAAATLASPQMHAQMTMRPATFPNADAHGSATQSVKPVGQNHVLTLKVIVR
jgi:hypothetical protein